MAYQIKRRRTVDSPRKRPSDLNIHRSSCGVCTHKDQLDIERAYKAHEPLKWIVKEFDVKEASLKTHARAFPRLEFGRKKNILAVLDMAIEKACDQIAKMDFKPQHIADLVMKRAQVAGTLVHLTADVTARYASKTDDEMLYFAENGEWPEDSHPPDCDRPGMMDEPAKVQ